MGEMQQVDILAAVVDGIPFPNFATPRCSTESERLMKGSPTEGISVLVTDTETASPDLWSQQTQRTTTQQSSLITFQIGASSENVGGAAVPRRRTRQSLQLPVANTLFHNGHSSTMFAQRWIPGTTSATGPEMLRIRHIRKPEQTLHITGLFKSRLPVIPELPLVALTSPRTVVSSVGNIVKTFKGRIGSSERDSVPASSELEQSVSLWTKSHNYLSQPARVWALVTPSVSRSHELLATDMSLQSAISLGSRLHKVLSGGVSELQIVEPALSLGQAVACFLKQMVYIGPQACIGIN